VLAVKATDLIKDLRVQLEGVKASGQTGVTVQALQEYLAAAEPVATAAEDARAGEQALAKAKHEFEVWKTQAPMQHAAAVEVFKSALEAGQTALRFLLAINGGGAVALLAFLGNVLSKEPPKGFSISVRSVNLAMATFVAGVGLAAATAIIRYFTQYAAAARWRKWVGVIFTVTAMFLGFASLAAFILGGTLAYRAFG
jgi:hypothetical protein